MCTETFLRLPEEKRTRFLDAAWEEFTRVKYSDVSINKIVQGAGIPRGSFYQYFADKDDLFDYLGSGVCAWTTGVVSEMLEKEQGDLFRVFGKIYDHLTEPGKELPPLLDRFLRVLRLNVGMDIEKTALKQQEEPLSAKVWGMIDASGFRRRDEVYVRQVFDLAGLALGGAITDCLCKPERRAELRRELDVRFDIIQAGCLAG